MEGGERVNGVKSLAVNSVEGPVLIPFASVRLFTMLVLRTRTLLRIRLVETDGVLLRFQGSPESIRRVWSGRPSIKSAEVNG